ncbi:MAG: tetratricopeptide repeat protein [Pseudomonadota bacterium]
MVDAYYILGTVTRERGNLLEAIDYLTKTIALKPDFEMAYRDLCLLLFQTGQIDIAKNIIKTGLSINPGCADYHFYLGNLTIHENKFNEAIVSYQQTLAIQPDYPGAHFNLGKAFKAQGDMNAAQNAYQKALSLKPDYAEACLELGNLFKEQGKPDDALSSYQKALAINPDYVEVYLSLGNFFTAQGALDKALDYYQKTLSLRPEYVEALLNLGNLFHQMGNQVQALAMYRKALVIKPDSAAAYNNMGSVFEAQRNLDEALACYQKALAIKPDAAEAHNNLGNVFKARGNLDEAAASYEKAISLNNNHAEALHNLGTIFNDQRHLDKALECYGKALEINPEFRISRTHRLHLLQHVCDWEQLTSDIGMVRRAITEPTSPVNNWLPPFAFFSLPGTTAAEQRLCSEKWSASEFAPVSQGRAELHFNVDRPPNAKIHVGYLSADFHQHATALLMAEVFELHDRNRFRIIAYSYGPDDGSAMRKRLEKTFDEFVDIRSMSDKNAAKKIHEDRIDILVDLKGYTQGSRSAILALRPAPIQVNYLGYPGTMGNRFVDYLIADRFIIPPGQEEHYTEKVICLPDCYQPNDRTRSRLAAPSRAACGLPEAGTVFCCFNQTYKISPDIFGVWCQLLNAVPDSVLWLLASNPHAEANLKREAKSRGIDGSRLVMAPPMESGKHLARLQCADLFLDTLACNAHTTCSDALWMGLPVITCAGDTFPSRVAGSLLTAMNVPELVTYTLDDYRQLALDLATDKNRREQLRRKIIANCDSAPLFDSTRFTHNLEQAYTQMWNDHVIG